MARLVWPFTCLDCGHGDIELANPGAAVGHRSHAVIRCLGCGSEWHAEVNLARVGGAGARPAHSRRTRRAVDELAAQAHTLVRSGHSIAAACRTVGIARHSYHDRYGPSRRTTRKAAA